MSHESATIETEMDDTGGVVITQLFGVTPLGDEAPQIGAAVKAGLSALQECDAYQCLEARDAPGELPYLRAASVPLVDPDVHGSDRVQALLKIAMTQLHESMDYFECRKTSLVILVNNEFEGSAISELENDIHQWLDTKMNIRVIAGDAVEFFRMVLFAEQHLKNGDLDCCIVGAVDTWMDPEKLADLDECGQLKTDRNPDGFNPGEACCLLVLETSVHTKQNHRNAFATVGGIAEGKEDNHFNTGSQSTGYGLAEAIRSVLPGENQHFGSVYCDLNGESYRAFEWGLISSRLGHHLDPIETLVHPADCCGDVGVASGALLMLCASISLRQCETPNPILIWLSGRSDRRIALSLWK